MTLSKMVYRRRHGVLIVYQSHCTICLMMPQPKENYTPISQDQILYHDHFVDINGLKTRKWQTEQLAYDLTLPNMSHETVLFTTVKSTVHGHRIPVSVSFTTVKSAFHGHLMVAKLHSSSL